MEEEEESPGLKLYGHASTRMRSSFTCEILAGEKVVFILTLTSPSQGRTQKYFGGYFAHMYNTIVKARDWSEHPSDPTWRFSLL